MTQPTVVTYSQARSAALLWLLLLLLLVPISGIVLAAIMYRRHQIRQQVEKATFAELGFVLTE